LHDSMLFFRAYMDQWFLSEELYQHVEDVVMERGTADILFRCADGWITL
jgi:hypothetical protein